MDDYYDAAREREDAMFAESMPYNAFAEADRERHWLWLNGFTHFCECSRCEGEREAAYEDAEWEAQAAEAEAAVVKA